MSYYDFFLMDILGMSKKQIAELDDIEYYEAITYSTTAFNMRDMNASDKPSTAGKDVAYFDQDPDFDHDPLFTSHVGN